MATPSVELILLKAVATRLGCTPVLDHPEEYLGHWKRGLSNGLNSGGSKAESMESYIASWWMYADEQYQRKLLLMKLFQKSGYRWTDDAMTIYSAWVKTYVPPPTEKTNRYKKMTEFLRIHAEAFTNL
jgi:hypothetical protein